MYKLIYLNRSRRAVFDPDESLELGQKGAGAEIPRSTSVLHVDDEEKAISGMLVAEVDVEQVRQRNSQTTSDVTQ
jgi:hypothetical protein